MQKIANRMSARGDHIAKMELHYLYRGVTKTINLQTAH